MVDLEKIAWKNLNENSIEEDRKTIVSPQKVGEVYPLSSWGGNDFLGIYLGQHQLFKKSPKKMIFTIRDKNEDYHLYSSDDGLMIWHSEGDDGPCWPAGILVHYIDKASKENKEGIEKRFKEIFDEEDKLTLKE
jgi:hypothetical protein